MLAYDDGCHLKKFLLNRYKEGATFAGWLVQRMHIIVDKYVTHPAPALPTRLAHPAPAHPTHPFPQVPLAEPQEQPVLQSEREPGQLPVPH